MLPVKSVSNFDSRRQSVVLPLPFAPERRVILFLGRDRFTALKMRLLGKVKLRLVRVMDIADEEDIEDLEEVGVFEGFVIRGQSVCWRG